MSPVGAPATAPLLRDLRERVFGLAGSSEVPRIGIEVELLPPVDGTGTPLPLRSDRGSSTLGMVRRAARAEGWTESPEEGGAPRFRVPGGGIVSFEPGGQVEYSSPPLRSVDRVAERARTVVEALRIGSRAEGARLRWRAMEPGSVPPTRGLELESARYRRLATHLDRIGEAGRRMMLRTAAIHVNLDLGRRPLRRWRTANALVPPLLASFANSARYDGRGTRYRSYRARQWRELDPARTGVFGGDAGPEAYLTFALDAGAILLGPEDEVARPFREWLESSGAPASAWREHLSTLFPEVRPRGYLEIRALDTLPPRWLSVPLVLLAGILYDSEALRTAAELLDPADEKAMEDAARDGLHDAERAGVCRDLFDLALEGAGRLGPEVVGGAALERTGAFRDRYPARQTDPAADPACGDALGP